MSKVSPFGAVAGDRARGFDFFPVFIALEVGVILLFGLFTNYGPGVSPSLAVDGGASVEEIYPLFQDVHVMVFVGFGFLMSFLRLGSFTATAITLLIGAFSLQWGILNVAFFHRLFDADFSEMISLDVTSLVVGDFAAAAVLITFGVLIGKVSPTQMMVLAVLEIPVYAANETILINFFKVEDVGGTMVIHMFGAFFGLAASLVLQPKNFSHRKGHHVSVYHSDVFAMIGTLFLWMYWPSFNSVLAGNALNKRHRVIVNTVLAMTGSCVFTFLFSRLLRKQKKFDMVDIQNATLAGGVGIGACAGMVAVSPWSALLVGSVVGVVSTFGYVHVQDYLESKMKFFDTCGVNNLHGLPSIVGAIAGIIFASRADNEIVAGRSGQDQALNQLYGTLVTLALSLFGGAVVGFILRFFTPDESIRLFDDSEYFFVPEEELPQFHATPTKQNATVSRIAVSNHL